MPGEWWTKTWNPVTGCSPVSEGCRNCWAQRMARRLAGRCGYPGGDGFAPTLHEDRLNEPLGRRKPEVYFSCGMGDLFHSDVPLEWIARVWAVMMGSQHHTYMILTKRPERAAELLPRHLVLPNVWVGVSVEDQATADRRIPWLLRTPAAHRFVSYEPALGPIDLDQWIGGNFSLGRCDICSQPYEESYGAHSRRVNYPCPSCAEWRVSTSFLPALDLVIAGGETGPGARPAHPDWFRSVRDQCAAAGVDFHFKQWGSHYPADDLVGRDLDGREHNAGPHLEVGR